MNQHTALIVVDLQNDYFPAGKWELDSVESASANAARLLDTFRKRNQLVVHVRHEFPTDDAPFFVPGSQGAEHHTSVQPADGEPVVVKHQINSFRDTDLKAILDDAGIKRVVIVGAMSHMCIDAVTRAANDFGYQCTVAHDACATLALEFLGKEVPSDQVHAAFMAALAFGYAQVISTNEVLESL
ncbi:Streptothricin hydrolase [Rosistilla carotiformis]|uniref:Streptothricin hydrolase n=1 Tax=Rosistilla carotiformis TaxID=2528017 RepID=A0A518JRK5_9BACT|nr:cysteine hydrolase family protein [Rosistilla carotiformis]QDV68172.1 Streptothricin hydrolase [Rosistilla carotiformis]